MFAQKNLSSKQHHGHDDRAVRNIKRRPVVRSKVKVEKISHRALKQPIPEIAQRTAEKERE